MSLQVMVLFGMTIVFGGIVLLVMKHEKDVNIKRASFLLLLNLFLWPLFIGLFHFFSKVSLCEWMARILFVNMGMLVGSFVFCSMRFQKRLSLWITCSIFSPSIIFAYLILNSSYIISSVVLDEQSKAIFFGPGHIMFDLYMIVFALFALGQLIHKYHFYRDIEKLRLKYIVSCSLVAITVSSITNLALLWMNVFEFLWVGPFVTLCLLVVTLYGIIKCCLLDIKLIIARATLFMFVYIPLLLVPIIITLLKQKQLMDVLGGYFWIFPTIIGMCSTGIGMFIYRGLQVKTEHFIMKEEYKHEEAIKHISDDLVQVEEMQELAEKIVKRCKEAVGVHYVSVYIFNKNSQNFELSYEDGKNLLLDQNVALNAETDDLVKAVVQKQDCLIYEELFASNKNVALKLKELKGEVIVPALKGKELLAFLILGNKDNENFFTTVELMALKVLANQIALSVQNARFLIEMRNMEMKVNEAQRMKEIGYLASAIGHEVGNGLQIIAVVVCDLMSNPLYLQHISEDEASKEEYMKRMDAIMGQIMHLRKVIEELSHFIRQEDVGEFNRVELNKLFDNVLTLVKVRNPGMKKMDIEVEGFAMIKGNAVQLQTLFYNMLNNSYDAIQQEKRERAVKDFQGNIRIHIHSNDDLVNVRIIDNGIGMDAETRKKLFIPLFTTKSAEKRKEERLTGGIGIGMYTIRKIVNAHKGGIEIKWSEQHQGTEFIVTLPKNMAGAVK